MLDSGDRRDFPDAGFKYFRGQVRRLISVSRSLYSYQMPDAANCRLLHRHEKFFCRRKMVKGPSGALKLSEVSGEPSQGVDEEGMAEVLLKLRTLHKIVPSLTPPFSLLPEQIQILKEVADDLYRDTRHFLLNRQPSCVSSPNPDPESMAVFRKFYGMDFYITGTRHCASSNTFYGNKSRREQLWMRFSIVQRRSSVLSCRISSLDYQNESRDVVSRTCV